MRKSRFGELFLIATAILGVCRGAEATERSLIFPTPREIVQSGSVFEAAELITRPMQEIVKKHLPNARLIRLEGPPVVGPLMLGMQVAGIDPYPLRKKLIESAKELVK